MMSDIVKLASNVRDIAVEVFTKVADAAVDVVVELTKILPDDEE